MAVINDLIDRISDPELRRRINDEVVRLQQQKKFGLVFEEHLPEATPLYDVPIKVKSLVARKDGYFKEFFRVKRIEGETLFCEREDDSHEQVELKKNEAVAVAQFGQPIYPYLKSMDAVKNAPDSDLWHTLIEADNYHALQLLVYLYGGLVDCIYIDPPYNTGDKSWKYNNDYVDSSDSYRHSKWLSMMKKRLILAKKLLNPQDSVLIVTIDEKEYLRLGCLLEELFPDATIQMVTSIINRKGVSHKGKRGETNREQKVQFSRVSEFIFFVMNGSFSIAKTDCNMLEGQIASSNNDGGKVQWLSMLRRGSAAKREEKEKHFYPIYVNPQTKDIVEVGEYLPLGLSRETVNVPEGLVAVWPLRTNGDEGRWQCKSDTFKKYLERGWAKLGSYNKKKDRWAINYLNEGLLEEIEKGTIEVIGKDEKGSLILNRVGNKYVEPKSVWNQVTHNASEYGTSLLQSIIGPDRFDYPKSLYAVKDTLHLCLKNKPNALIIDFFAGSGTTLHAVNLLNAEDNGKRRCIMVTNNEVSAEEESRLKNAGLQPGQEEWDKWGIARYVNWPRTKCSILGVDVNNNPINGTYQTYLKQEKEKERTIKQITLIDNPSSMKIAQKKELVAFCCQGKLPQSLVKADSKFIVSENYPCTILFDINYIDEWLEALEDKGHLMDIYIVTRNNEAFKKAKADIIELLGNITEEESVLSPMRDGFKANAKFFKLGFLDKNSVAAYRQFRELLSLLWMKAGAVGECPTLKGKDIPDYLILEDNKMAILTEEWAYAKFMDEMKDRQDIKTVFLVVDSEIGFREMAAPLKWAKTYQLYKDYLENFTINYDK